MHHTFGTVSGGAGSDHIPILLTALGLALISLLIGAPMANAVYFDVGVATNTYQEIELGGTLVDLKLLPNSYEGPLKYEVVSGSLPAGVIIDEDTGKFMSGVGAGAQLTNPAQPAAAGTTHAVIQVTDLGPDGPRPQRDYVVLEVTVNPIVDPVQTTVTFFPTHIAAGGQETATVTFRLRDGNGAPLNNMQPELTIRHGEVITSGGIMEATGIDGTYEAKIKSSIPGTSVITVRVPPNGWFDGGEFTADAPITFRNTNPEPAPFLVVPPEERTVIQFSEAPVRLTSNITTNLGPDDKLMRARVYVMNYEHGKDELGFLDERGNFYTPDPNEGVTLAGNIVARWVQATVEDKQIHVLDFYDEASAEDYEAALKSVYYRYNGQITSGIEDREVRISLIVLDENWYHDTDTGHYYESFSFPKGRENNKSWGWAEQEAASRSFHGMQGYLATITSEHENNFVSQIAESNAWIGALDVYNKQGERHEARRGLFPVGDPVWMWVTGPETGQVFWRGGSNGHVEPGMYAKWAKDEPNRYQVETNVFEYYGTIYGSMPPVTKGRGLWNDLPFTYTKDQVYLDGYIIEYGGLEGDPRVKFFEDIVVQVGGRPIAQFTADPREVRVGELVMLTNLSYHPERTAPDADATDRLAQFHIFEWEYGDGTGQQTTGAGNHPTENTITYGKLGQHTIRLRGQETNGSRWSVWESQTVTVKTDILGYVFIDGNRDGHRGMDELGLGTEFPNAEVVLLQDGVEIARAPSRDHPLNVNSGAYRFTGLDAGEYEVRVVKPGTLDLFVPDDWLVTTAGQEPRRTFVISETPVTFEVGTVAAPHLGYAPEHYVISGTVFIDDGRQGGTANDGVRNGGEPGAYGVRLRVYDDENNGLLHPVLTDGQGRYEAYVHGDYGRVELVLQGTGYNPTGYTPGADKPPVKLDAFGTAVVAFSRIVAQGGLTGIDFGVVPPFAVDGTNPGTAGAGGMQLYPFTVTPGTKGEVEFTVKSPRGWQYTIYRDVNKNGQLDSGEAPVSGPVEASPGMDHFLLQVWVPTSVSDGTVDVALVTAELTYENNGDLVETRQFYAITTAHSVRLQLTVSVRNETAGEQFAPVVTAGKTGDVLEYKIVYHNVDAAAAESVWVHGTVPPATVLKGDAYGPGRAVSWQPPSGQSPQYPDFVETGHGFSVPVGDVMPGQQGVITYQVIIR